MHRGAVPCAFVNDAASTQRNTTAHFGDRTAIEGEQFVDATFPKQKQQKQKQQKKAQHEKRNDRSSSRKP
jgi:hypothetical protein